MGAVDLVVQIEAPTSVASGMQRIGRASHHVEAVSRGVIFPKYRGDLLASAAITKAMKEGAVEETHVPQNPLDVLAQHLVAMVALGERKVDELYALVRRAAPFAALARAQFEGVLDMLSGRYPSDEFAELRPRVVWDRLRGIVKPREGAQRLAVQNAGTIPDRGLYGVFLADGGDGGGKRVGELDEEMVFESRAGEVFVLGATSWRITEITRDRVLVVPAPGEPGKMPFWKADRGGRPVELGRAIGRLTRELLAVPRDEATERLQRRARPRPAGGAEPPRLPRGAARGHRRPARRPHDRPRAHARRDGRLAALPPLALGRPGPRAVGDGPRGEAAAGGRGRGRDDLERRRDRAPPARARAPAGGRGPPARARGDRGPRGARAGRDEPLRRPLPRGGRPGPPPAAPPAGPAHAALDAAEARRRPPAGGRALPVLPDRPRDLPRVPARRVRPAGRWWTSPRACAAARSASSPWTPQAPSPFSASLLFGYVANYLYDGDAPLAERRAQALAVDQAQLRELLGEAELRELLDRRALAELEIALQCLDAPHQATSAERLHDLLLRLGDLSPDEVVGPRAAACRTADAAAAAQAWLDALERERRAIRVHLAGEERCAAAEDAGRLRDALGVAPPPGLPAAFLESRTTRSRDVVSRYARTHGPFTAADVARRFATGEAPVLAALADLAKDGRVLEGEFRPGGSRARVVRRGRARHPPPSLARGAPQAGRAGRADGSGAAARGLAGRRHRTLHAPRPRRAARRGRAAAGAVAPRLDPRAGRPARAPPRLPAGGPRRALARPARWCGSASARSGERDGRIALFLADDLPLLLPGRPEPSERRRPRADPRAPRPPRGVLLRGDPRRGRGRARAAGAGRALGPGLVGRGHERHAGGAPGLPRGARGAGRSADTAWRASARAGRSRPRSWAAGACCPPPAGPRAPPRG